MGGRTGRKVVAVPRATRRGNVGEQIFTEVEHLTAGGAMERTAAIARVAERIGSNPGTVAANYYRIARQRGVALRPRRPRGSTAGKGRGAVSARLAAAIRAVDVALRSQAQELDALRKGHARFEKLRRLLRQ